VRPVFPLKDNIPTARFPIVTVLLIAVNLVVFVYQLSLPDDRASTPALAAVGVSERDELAISYGAIPYRITHPGDGSCGVARTVETQEVVCEGAPAPSAAAIETFAPLELPAWWLTLLTSMFMHAGLLHFGGNMLFLWVFGANIEDSMGRARFVLFYLLAGVVAVYGQALLDVDSTLPTIGASGAVAGVLGAYALLHPHARVLTIVFVVFFFTFIEIPALVLLTIWFLLQFVPAVGQLASPELSEGGGVAYFAHVAGFLFGLAMIRLFARRDEPPRSAAIPH
jgi:membrane associated rhomboid family serine protease